MGTVINKNMTEKLVVGKIEQLTQANFVQVNGIEPLKPFQITTSRTQKEIELEEEVKLLKNQVRNSYATQQKILKNSSDVNKTYKLKNEKLRDDNLFLRDLILNKYKSFLSIEELNHIEKRFSIKKYGKKIKNFLSKSQIALRASD